ncbi:hypothetical protein HanIR_Chr02g0068461 [Helianthus annuus]|nr:hypothetical protein HanIR_Chr02g0068461 [Helianthus annuus]
MWLFSLERTVILGRIRRLGEDQRCQEEAKIIFREDVLVILTNRSHAVVEVEEDVVVIDPSVISLSNLVGKAVVGRALGFKEIMLLRSSLSLAGYEEANIQYLGGLTVLISCQNEDKIKGMLDDKEAWKRWFSTLSPWIGQPLPYECLAWINIYIYGVPPHLVSRGVFDSIGSRYGKVVQPSQFVETDADLTFDRLGILLDSGNKIDGVINLSWQDKRYKIWVVEEDSDQWVPDFLEDDEASVAVSSEVGVFGEFSAGNPPGNVRSGNMVDEKLVGLSDEEAEKNMEDLENVNRQQVSIRKRMLAVALSPKIRVICFMGM